MVTSPAYKQRGLTLIELIMVMVVIGVLAAISVPFMAGIFGKDSDIQAEQERDRLISHLRIARSHALAQTGGDAGALFVFTGCNGNECSGWEAQNANDGSRNIAKHQLEGLRVQVPSSAQEITFDYPDGSLSGESEDNYEFSIKDRPVCVYSSTGLIRRGPCN